MTYGYGWNSLLSARRLHLLIAALLLAGMNATFSGPIPHRVLSGGNDFLSFYAGGRLSGTAALYDHSSLKRVQHDLGWDSDTLPFIRIPVYAAALAPLSWLPYKHAYVLWQALNIVALVAFVAIFPGAPWQVTAVAVLASYPLVAVLWSGQDLAFVLLALAIGLRMLERHRPLAAGLILSLCMIKFHLFLTFPILLLRRRMWRCGGGLVIGVGALLALCFVVQGPGWIRAQLGILQGPAIQPNEFLMPNLHGLLYGVPYSLFAEIIAAVAVLYLVWRAVAALPEDISVAVALAGGLLVSYHSYLTDAALLIPSGLIVFGAINSAITRSLTALVLLPPLYVMLLFPGPFSLAGKLGILAFFSAISLGSKFLKRTQIPFAGGTNFRRMASTMDLPV